MQAEKFTNIVHDASEAFEGPEKTLRLYFTVVDANIESSGLLSIPRNEWESALDLVKCKVLSVLVHPKVHAYVLSESSLFVYPHHIVLKTCGTTTLIDGLSKLIEIVGKYTQSTGIGQQFTTAFYSRRSYFKPEKQCHPHGNWSQEVHRLQHFFQNSNFNTQFGVSKEERWHFFSHAPHNASHLKLSDGFIEMMMTGLDEECASKFFLPTQSLEDSVMSLDSVTSLSSQFGAEPDDDDPGHQHGNVMTKNTEIDAIYLSDRQTIDSFAFSPCGYSCNGILLDEGKYFTIHVTPEKGYSYASFETNVLEPEKIEKGLTHLEVVKRVLNIFNPEKLTFVTCTPFKVEIDIESLTNYVCTSMAEFDVGKASVTQFTLTRST